MPQGKPLTVPDDGLSTRERRQQPLLMVHTGDGKGKSTAAFGLAIRAWNQGWNVGVFQFVKSAKWRIGEQTVLERLGELHRETGEGGPVPRNMKQVKAFLEGKTGPADPGHRLAAYLLDYICGKRSEEAMDKYWDRAFAEPAGPRMTG